MVFFLHTVNCTSRCGITELISGPSNKTTHDLVPKEKHLGAYDEYKRPRVYSSSKMNDFVSLFCLFFFLITYKAIFFNEKEAALNLLVTLACISLCLAHLLSYDGAHFINSMQNNNSSTCYTHDFFAKSQTMVQSVKASLFSVPWSNWQWVVPFLGF